MYDSDELRALAVAAQIGDVSSHLDLRQEMTAETVLGLLDEIERLRADSWVSIKDRLPNEREMVLVFRPDAHHLPACDPNIDVRAYFGNGVFNGLHEVTHWMPLPADPA